MTTDVTLDPVEVHTCEVLAALRHSRHLTRPNGRLLGRAWIGRDQDAVGVVGEYAVAKALNRFAPFVLEDPWGPEGEFDVGRLYQVRATMHKSGGLMVYKEDDPLHVYILARVWHLDKESGVMTVRVGGWLWGAQAQMSGYWRTKSDGMRSAAYLVPASELSPMSELPGD